PRPVGDPAQQRTIEAQLAAPEEVPGFEESGQGIGRGDKHQATAAKQGFRPQTALAQSASQVLEAGGSGQGYHLLADFESSHHKLIHFAETIFSSDYEPACGRLRWNAVHGAC